VILSRAPRLKARSFVVYYGYGPLPELSAFDVAILEPQGWRLSDVRRLQERGTRALAYLSALEVMPHRVAPLGLTAQDFLTVAGSPWRRPPLPNLIANPLSPRWRRELQKEARRLVAEGWDGLFLDTLGDIEDPVIQKETSWLVPAAADLVATLRREVGDRLLVLNNAIALLVPLAYPHLDGVSWEIAREELPLTSPWAQFLLDVLAQAATKSGLARLLTTSIPAGPPFEGALQEFYGFARRQGFLAYATPEDYVRSVRMPDGRVLPGRTSP
jgi:hypothetical protein